MQIEQKARSAFECLFTDKKKKKVRGIVSAVFFSPVEILEACSAPASTPRTVWCKQTNKKQKNIIEIVVLISWVQRKKRTNKNEKSDTIIFLCTTLPKQEIHIFYFRSFYLFRACVCFSLIIRVELL